MIVAAGTGEAAKAGPLALAVILALAIVCYFLFRSMSHHMKKVRQGFPGDARPEPPERPAPPDDPGAAGPAA